MNTNPGMSRLVFWSIFAGIILVGAAVMAAAWAAHETNEEDTGYTDARPWFDGKSYPYFLDMFNQASLKPQEEGTIQVFPVHSVPRTGVELTINPLAIVDGQLLGDRIPANPTTPTRDSLARGRVLFDTFCAVCHGLDGNAGTPVTLKGMPAPPIRAMIPIFSDAHLYNKIRYGGPIMPTYGFQTTQSERWDMVNYMKSADFGKETTQQ